MSFLSAGRLLNASKSLSALTLHGLRSQTTPKLNFQAIQVRTATKKVAGSRTNMRDSAGRRLGAKVAENEPVKTGQILYRQRGTKFYPGENAGIGKDHTIFALEPGYVRFYMDPFHPERKFIGVALAPELRLPTPHFSPRVRRLGYEEILDEKKAAFEENNLARKHHLLRPTIEKQLEQRQLQRESVLTSYSEQIAKLASDLNEDEVLLAAERLLFIKTHIQNGTKLSESQAIATFTYFQNLRLEVQRGQTTQEEATQLRAEYSQLALKVDSLISFDNQYKLISFITEEQRLQKVAELDSKLKTLFADINKKTKNEIKSLIFENNLINATERKRLISKYLKSVLPEPTGLTSPTEKKASISKRWNYEKSKVEVVARSKEAFPFK
ncbi:hypothetical protein WICPIJ_003389 [Wickerhamomyces pijperi]|uniref:Large ribosomal subunit protein bL27m n=1 Tax=Wickerhamomyces pijperi TaxID=599730 RepID=A0A9P8Q7X3_WICPI|nr:hypothetical protein WICPIJ_003389 [Wickerhamomyces pijperi]